MSREIPAHQHAWRRSQECADPNASKCEAAQGARVLSPYSLYVETM
jgi:hypothetical protein